MDWRLDNKVMQVLNDGHMDVMNRFMLRLETVGLVPSVVTVKRGVIAKQHSYPPELRSMYTALGWVEYVPDIVFNFNDDVSGNARASQLCEGIRAVMHSIKDYPEPDAGKDDMFPARSLKKNWNGTVTVSIDAESFKRFLDAMEELPRGFQLVFSKAIQPEAQRSA